MTSRSRSKGLDDLKAEITSGRGEAAANEHGHDLGERAKDHFSHTVDRLTAEKDKLESELSVIEERLSSFVRKEGAEFEDRIREHPLQSVLIAFAVGFVASRIFRI